MVESKPQQEEGEPKQSRKDVLESYSQMLQQADVTESSHRRPFLGGIITSLLGVTGIAESASATPDPNEAEKTLRDHEELISVLIDNGLLDEEILEISNKHSAVTISDSSYVRAESLDDTLTSFTFPGSETNIKMRLGDDLTDLSISLPDDVNGEEISKQIGRQMSGVSYDSGSACCDDSGYCGICSDHAESACITCIPIFGCVCGSYNCNVIACQPDDYINPVIGQACGCCGDTVGNACPSVPTCWEGEYC